MTGAQRLALPPALARDVASTLAEWDRGGKVRRLWARDAGLWTGGGEAGWLGWLDSVAVETARVEHLARFAGSVRQRGFTHSLLVGMGGSSLGPEVIAATFGRQTNYPELVVLDSTDPAQIRTVERRIDPARTLFIVSSKSGTTLEPNILMQYFYACAEAAVGAGKAGDRFVAITDPGSALEAEAGRRGFGAIFHGIPSIGGRYSVLSPFGLVPAAAMGVDVARLLDESGHMVRACGPDMPAADNPCVALGIALGLAAKAGRDKLTILAAPGLAAFGAWLEQLVAESTGKHGIGIVPVDGEPPGRLDSYGTDRLFVELRLDADGEGALAHDLERAGHPVVHIDVAGPYQLGQEFFRWEVATAVAGSILGIDPFDQPDVEASKVKTRALTGAFERTGRLPDEQPRVADCGIALFADVANAESLAEAATAPTLEAWLGAHLARIGPGDYCALLAYIARDPRHEAALTAMRAMIRDRKRVATCVGFGPRFLHSTGQVYKGGPNSGVFLQITCAEARELPVPGQSFGFGVVKAAQARGDFDVLAERGRRALRIHLGEDVEAGLTFLVDAIRRVLG